VKTTVRIAAVALILNCPLSRAQAQVQAPGQLPEFEVASIKPNKTNERMYYGLRNASLSVRNLTVKGLIQIAYGKRDFQITGGPAWNSLVVARGGLKMKLSADQTEPEKGGPKELGPGRVVGEGIPMYVIANLLSNMLGRAVVNNTGLTGKYDVNLQPVPDPLQLPTDPADSSTQTDVLNLAIVEAVEKQLGLKIESIKAPVEALVIDRIEHPSAN
jgi:hypothetical protein